ncbi:MAG TPA: glycosyltransferase family 2 protein [Verrucomicrobiota bacterium]|nr:glycosyltransferase family 2 protein [Verrucomicrobiota bacterium]
MMHPTVTSDATDSGWRPSSDARGTDLSIVIINWNGADYVRGCLRSILATPPRCSYEVIVADAASFDGCGEMVAREYPQVRFLQLQDNVGFARANNAAVRLARGKLLLFLNPDTEVLSDAIDQLVAVVVNHQNAGVVGARLLNSDRSVQVTCIKSFPSILGELLGSEFLQSRLPRWKLWGMAALSLVDAKPAPVEVISGACMLMRREIFEKIGGFNSDYFMYSEDVELCYSASRMGLQNLYVPGAQVVHHGGKSSEQTPGDFSVRTMRESRWRYFRKHRGLPYALAYRAAMFISALVRASIASVASLLFPARTSTWRDTRRKWWVVARWAVGLK